MIKFLMLAHVALFVLSILRNRQRGLDRLRNLTIPVGFGFIYVGVVQARAALKQMAVDLDLQDVQAGLWVSLISYLTFLLAYWSGDSNKKRLLFTDGKTSAKKLNFYGLGFCMAGCLGYYLNIHKVGGLLAYLNMKEWSGNLYEMSAYIIMLKYAVYGAIGVFLVSLALDKLPKLLHLLLVLLMLGVLLEAIQLTSRGNTIRAVMPIIAWVYFLSRNPRDYGKHVVAGNVIILTLLAFVMAAVLLLPHFRDTNRSLATSETTLAEAVQETEASQGGNRVSENGGEFDTGVRIVKWVNEGRIHCPGPWHIARWMWNVVPRTWVPNKHEIFASWAGPEYAKIQFEAESYLGCSLTGWGEAYGTMGWFGILYWLALGYGVRKFESWTGVDGKSRIGLMITVACYGPLLQCVGMDFWGAAMNTCIFVVPFLVILRHCQKVTVPNRRRSPRQPVTEPGLEAPAGEAAS